MLFNKLLRTMRKALQDSASHRSTARRRGPWRLQLEALENRLVPTTWNYTHLVQVINQSNGAYPHNGPTHLYLNFDGKDSILPYANGSVAQTTQDIEQILFMASEVYAPFNVEVSEITGKGNYDQSNTGATTIFIGYDPSNVNAKGKFARSYTPALNADFPGINKFFDHTPNSDGQDVAYVDPFSSKGVQSVSQIVSGVVHEAGHTFGLAHVRTDVDVAGNFLQDPLYPTPGTVPDVMSYTDNNLRFANQTFPTTGWNNTPSGLQLDRLNEIPKWVSLRILGIPVAGDDVVTQNSFTYLENVLGDRPAEPGFRAIHSNLLDSGVVSKYVINNDTLTAANHLSASGTIANLGDFDVNQWTATADQTIRIDVNGSNGLLPVLLVYGSDGTNSVFFNTQGVNLPVKKGVSYQFVVGGAFSQWTGDYNIQLNTLTINGDADIANENDVIRLVRDAAQPSQLDVFINNNTPVPTFQATFSTLTYINIDGKGGSNTIILDFSQGNVAPGNGIHVEGAQGFDTLQVIGPNLAKPQKQTFLVHPDELDLLGQGAIAFDQVEMLQVTGGKGDDLFDVRGTDPVTHVMLSGGAGNDTFQIDSDGGDTSTGTVKNVRSEIDIDGGGGGVDMLTVNDVSDAVATQVTIGPLSVGADATDNYFGKNGKLFYSNLRFLNVNMGSSQRDLEQENVVYVTGTSAGTDTLVNCGANGDFVFVGTGSPLGTDRSGPFGLTGGVSSKLSIYGQGAATTLEVLDSAETSPRVATLTNTTLGHGSKDTLFGPNGYVYYQTIATLGVSLGSGGNTFNVQGTRLGTITSLHTGNGNDVILVGSKVPLFTGDLSTIAGPLTVDAGGGASNLLAVSDRAAISGNKFVGITGDLISGFAGPNDDVPIWFKGQLNLEMEGSDSPNLAETYFIIDPQAAVFLSAKAGQEMINVRSTHLPVFIQAGPGDVTVNVGNANGSLDNILGPVTVSGGNGNDQLQILDQGAMGDKTYDLDTQTLSRTGAALIAFQGAWQNLTLDTSLGNDLIKVHHMPNPNLIDVFGGTLNNTLTGPNQTNAWQITGFSAGVLNNRLNFSGIENLTGGVLKDTFSMAQGASLPGKIDGGGGGNDTLGYQNWNQPVIFDLSTPMASGLGSFANIQHLIGGSASDTLHGPNLPTLWSITGQDAGQVNTLNLGVLTFSSVENLQGGTGLDAYQFGKNGQLSGSITDQGGSNTLDFSLLPNSMSVRVNLLTGTATGVGGSVSGVENVTGGGGNDILVGDALPNVLTSGNGRNIIIGGQGSDSITGGNSGDILIGGGTQYDSDPAMTALNAIMKEWASNSSYQTRRRHILGQLPGGLNGNYFLSNAVAPDDGAVDHLMGGAGMNWFWADANDITNLDILKSEKNRDQP